jgi:glycosyltransferase involved in cell wall biosynthesis
VLAAGRLVDKKGFDVLIEACALLRDRGIPFTCRIVGEGPRRRALARAVQRRGLEPVVALQAWASTDEVIRLLAKARAFVAPSRIGRSGDRDGIPNVVLEAMAAGRPVVSTAVSGIPEAVVDGVTGLLVAPGDATALADALEKVLTDAALARSLGAAGFHRAIEEFDLERSSSRLAAAFGVPVYFAHVAAGFRQADRAS